MKKIVSFIVSLTLLFSMLVGCTGAKQSISQDSADKSNTSGVNNSSNVVKIKLWHYFTDLKGEVFKKSIDKFNESNKSIVIESEYVPREELTKQYTIGVVGGQLPDIGMVDGPDHASFAQMGVFLDITDKANQLGAKQVFFEGPLKSATLDGKIYGFPFDSNALALFYDEDVLKEAGVNPPKTWDELEKVCAAVTTKERYGLTISAVKTEEGTFQFIPWLLSAGGDPQHLDSPESVRALSYLTGLIEKGYMSTEVITYRQADIEKQFAAGQAAMMVNGPWNIPTIKKDAPEKNWNVTLFPKDKQYSSVLGGENFGIMSTTKNVDASWEVLKYLTSKEFSNEFSSTMSGFSPRTDVMIEGSYWYKDPILKVFVEEMKYAMPRGPHPKWPVISNAISTAYHEAYTKSKTPEQAFKNAQVEVEKNLKK